MKIEKEYKVLINQENFNNIIKNYNFKEVVQINHYYDNINLKNIAVRIREIKSKFIFTLKHVVNDQVIEHEIEVKENNIGDKDIQNILNNLNISGKLEYIGSLKTTRYLLEDEFGELCIDKNEYLDFVDYEIEYELFNHNDDKLDYFINLLKKNNIPYKENKIRKIKRFKDRLKTKPTK